MNAGESNSNSDFGNISDRSQVDELCQSQLPVPAANFTEHHYQAIFEAAIEAIIIIDDAGNIADANPSACRLGGLSRQELIGRCGFDFVWAGSSIHQCWEQCLQIKQMRGKMRLVCANGAERNVEYTATTQFIPHYHLIVLRDITGHDLGEPDRTHPLPYVAPTHWQQLEEDFQQVQTKLNDILSNAGAVIASFRLFPDQPPVYDFLSAATEIIFGYTPAAIMADPEVWRSRVLPEDLENVILPAMAHLVRGETITVEYRFLHKSNVCHWISETLTSRWNETSHCWQITSVAIDVTNRKQAELAMHQAISLEQQIRERERFIANIANNIRQSLQLNEILNTTVAEVRQFVEVDRVVIFRFNPDWSGQVVAQSITEANLSILDQVIYDPCFVQTMIHAYQQGRIHAINDILTANLPPCYQELLTGLQVRAILVLPILVHQQLWGLLVAHQCHGPRQWQELSWYLLRQLSTQLAIAIQQSALYQQVQQLNANLAQQVREHTTELQQALEFEALLKRITDNVRDSLDERQILQTTVQALAQQLDVSGCDVALYDFEQRVCEIRYEHLCADIPAAQGNQIPMDEDELFTQLLRGDIFQFCRLEPLANRPLAQQFAILSCPIVDNHDILGDLWLFRQADQTFNDAEIRLVQQVANQCAIAIRQARLYEAAQAQVTELERLNQLKDDFLSTVSHELRTPVSSIKMATQMLEIMLFRQTSSGLTEGSDLTPITLTPQNLQRINQYLQVLQHESQREIELINNLLDLTRLDAETEPLILTPIDLQIWLPHVVEPFMELMAKHQQQLHIDLPTNLPSLTTDLSYLQRILAELLTNANKYTPATGTITISAAINASEAPSQPHLLDIRVTNTGVEIPASELPRIFDRFYRIPNNDPWRYGGTGLGLALVQKLANRLQASVHVESEHDQVTVFLRFFIHP